MGSRWNSRTGYTFLLWHAFSGGGHAATLIFHFRYRQTFYQLCPGKLFDRASVAYLIKDHSERGQDTFHFYLAYFKPLFTDCNTEGYTAPSIGIAWWQRPKGNLSEIQRYGFYADNNCPRVSHVLAHELLRIKGKTKKDFFGEVHELWDKHLYNVEPFLYFDNQFKRVSGEDSYRFVTLNPDEL